MKNSIFTILVVMFLGTGCVTLKNAKPEQLASKLQKDDPKLLREKGTELEEENLKTNWPPPNEFSEGSLGMALQNKFKSHADFCGFVFDKSNKNYVPADIKKFLDENELNLKAESADIEGATIMFYMFSTNEKNQTFNKERYSFSKVLEIENFPQFILSENPNPNFDSFLMTKTCGGFVNASVDAGIKPPYTSFEMAVKNDSKKESSIIVLSGTFVSPLTELFNNHSLKTYAFLKLWEKYKRYPELIGKSHYLAEFNGVMIKRTASAEDYKSLEASGKTNYSGPLTSKVKADIGIGMNSSSIFKATDWETIILTNFSDSYKRENLFREFPSVDYIKTYFNGLSPIYETSPRMVENGLHDIVISMENIPFELSNKNYWDITDWPQNIYEKKPELLVDFNQENDKISTRFIIRGTAKKEFFTISNTTTELDGSFKITSIDIVDSNQLAINVNTKVFFSKQPDPQLPPKATFEPYRLYANSDKFGIKWSFEVGFLQNDNPVDFNKSGQLSNISVKNSNGDKIQITYDISVSSDKNKYLITVFDPTPYELRQISDNIKTNYNFEASLTIPLAKNPSNRTVSKTISLPFPSPEIKTLEKSEVLNQK